MKILGVDTTTMMGAVGIVDGDEPVAELCTNISVTHSERLMSHIDGLLKSARMTLADLDGFAVSIGPGSFTGLRIGIAAVKGLAYATGKPVAGVGSLDVIADNIPLCMSQVCPVLDARKKMVYAAVYSGGTDKRTLMEPDVLTPEVLADRISGPTVFVGEGAYVYRDLLAQRLGDAAVFAPRVYGYPAGTAVALRGHVLIEKGEAADPFTLVPHYIRKSDAEEKAGKNS
jgi:tRNA threonylcarbamoyladenosine biosynthesis protein TsaB